jgi:cupin fold WbuC family metalloprotein
MQTTNGEWEQESPEVYYARASLVSAAAGQVETLIALAETTKRKRARLCAHEGVDSDLHEMLIVHPGGAYVRPHKHPGKVESYHIISGLADLVTFTDEGDVARVLRIGDFSSGRTFYARLNVSPYHTLLIRSAVIVFHETTNGPFRPGDTQFAPWAPTGEDELLAQDFLRDLNQRIT